ncbi:MAG: acyl-CoA dehydrogenase [Streptosporangiales bacterium]|nr:acyl-CoA dehydrogenase [Streptosporangiales bacterium]
MSPVPSQVLDVATPGDELLRRVVGDFARNRIRPLAGELDATERFPAELYREMAELGLFGVTVPAELGGAGGTALDYLSVMEGLSYGYASVADQCGLVELVGTLLAEDGTPPQRERYLAPLLRTERRCAYALTEPGAGSDLGGVRTRARRRASGGWTLTGEKIFIHNAPVADFAAVLAVTDPERGKRGGVSVFLVDLDAPGVSRPYREHKMGQRASPVGGLVFDEVVLGDDALLGEEGQGFRAMMRVLAKGRLGIAGLALGISRAALDAAAEHAASRRQFGRPIGVNQAVAFPIADMVTEYRAALLLALDAARLLDSTACSMAKLFATEACVRHTATAVQIFGGSGYIQGYEVERLYRDARITTIYEGTSEMQRLIVSRAVLGRLDGGAG